MLFTEMNEVLDPQPHGAALNMAIDEVLLRRAAGPTLRVYGWKSAAVSFGYFEAVETVRQAWSGRDIVRRWTGGGVVPHGDDFTYSLMVPAGAEFSRRTAVESYREIHARIRDLLAELGVETRVASAAGRKVSPACFENPVPFDLLGAAGKIAGAAQRRTRWGLLHQGSIQRVVLPRDFAPQLAAGFARRAARRLISDTELAEANELAAVKYATAAWTDRR